MNAGQTTDLATRLASDGPLDPARAVNLVRQIAAAINESHTHQRVHRDITPATIVLSADDPAGIGVARLADVTPAADPALRYLAPELLGNSEVSYRADIYALSGVLYACLTGAPPTPLSPYADASTQLAARLTMPPPRPSQRRVGLPAGFDDVIARGMAVNPADRYRSVGELVAAAERALTTTGDASGSRTTQVVNLGGREQESAPTRAAQVQPSPPEATAVVGLPPAWDPGHGRGPTVTYPHSQPLPAPPASVKPRRRIATVLAALAAVTALAVLAALVIPRLTRHAAAPIRHTYNSKPVALPFPGLSLPKSVAVDGKGNVYVLSPLTDQPGENAGHPQLLKLAPGAPAATKMDIPSIDLRDATDIAADPAGNIYLTGKESVWELTAGEQYPIRLPFRQISLMLYLAVDQAGSVYAIGETPDDKYLVQKLVPGATRPTDLPFPGLDFPAGLAADDSGNVYVGTSGKDETGSRVRKLAAGATSPTDLSFPGLGRSARMAVDSSGNLFVADDAYTGTLGGRASPGGIFELPAGETTASKLPIQATPTGVAVDSNGNIYVACAADGNTSGQVLKIKPDK